MENTDQEETKSTPSAPADVHTVTPAGRIPAHQWRLVLPLLLIMLSAAAYVWQRQQYAVTGPLALTLSRQAEAAARIESVAQRAVSGERAAFGRLRQLRTQAAALESDARTAIADLYASGSVTGPDFGLEEVKGIWQAVRADVDRLLSLETATSTLRADVEAFQSIATGILVATDELVDALVSAEEPPAQIRTAARQLLLIQRISANVRRVLEGGDGVVTAADRFGRDAVLFGEVNIALLNGNARLGIQRIRAQAARDALVDIGREFRRGTELIEQIMADAVAMVEARQAVAGISEGVARMITRLDEIQRRLARHAAEQNPGPMLAEIFGLLAMLSLLVVMAHIAASTRRARIAARAQASEAAQRDFDRDERASRFEATEQATDQAVKRLIDELDQLAKGPASAEPPIRNGISDTPVAPLEVAVTGVRHRLRTLTQAAFKLANAGAEFGRIAGGARSVAEEQGGQVERAASATKRMAAHVETVGERGRKAERVSGESHALVNRAANALQTVASQVDETVAAAKTTAARVRQLNEATRQIQEVGRLVDEISEQCRMLSLNVSIRASLNDGSANVGSARFAEEVKKLADNARRAMRRIETVNEDVRSHAGQAADSVKQIMWAVENAVARSQAAGKDLSAAVVLSQRMETLNRQLVEALQEHTKLMTDVVKSTTSVHGVASRARHEFREVAAGGARLVELAGLLEAAVSGFDPVADNQRSVIELHAAPAAELNAPAVELPQEASADQPLKATGKE
ncbi:MAG TPA: methyl-accepting chemotaxis protein [Gammaproteobacteria bacterium]